MSCRKNNTFFTSPQSQIHPLQKKLQTIFLYRCLRMHRTAPPTSSWVQEMQSKRLASCHIYRLDGSCAHATTPFSREECDTRTVPVRTGWVRWVPPPDLLMPPKFCSGPGLPAKGSVRNECVPWMFAGGPAATLVCNRSSDVRTAPVTPVESHGHLWTPDQHAPGIQVCVLCAT